MAENENYPRARVEMVDGQPVLIDPDAVAMIRAVEKHNCKEMLRLNEERVRHFIDRIKARNDSPKQVVITLINVDDPHGGPIADILMPGHDWQAYRDRGELPIARGLAARAGIEDVLDLFDKDAAAKLRENEDIAIVVVDHGVAEVFTPEDLWEIR